MSVDGDWDVVVKTPMGDQPQIVTFKTKGDAFTGQHANPLATVDILDGRIEDGKLFWRVEITQPMPMKLDLEAVINGDNLSGVVKSAFGAMPMQGVRKTA